MKKFIQFVITGTGLRAIMGLDNITQIKINDTSTMYVYYAGSTSKITITFTNADSSFSSHYAVMQALNDAVVASSNPGGMYVCPTLPIYTGGTAANTISTIAYA